MRHDVDMERPHQGSSLRADQAFCKLSCTYACAHGCDLTQNGHPRTLGGHFNEEVRRCPTLPQGPPCSTIGAKSLSFRVRNVTGRFPLAMAAETLLMYQSERANQHLKCCLQVLDRTSRTTQWTRSIFVFKQRKCYQIIGLLVPVSSESL